MVRLRHILVRWGWATMYRKYQDNSRKWMIGQGGEEFVPVVFNPTELS